MVSATSRSKEVRSKPRLVTVRNSGQKERNPIDSEQTTASARETADAIGSQMRLRAIAIAEVILGSRRPPALSLCEAVVCTALSSLYQRELLLLLPQQRIDFRAQ